MKHTPTALKWLADKRRRLSADLVQTTAIAAEVNQRVETLRIDLEALDRALVIFDASIEPELLKPVSAHGRTGKRGLLREAVINVLQTHSPAWVATENIEALVCLELGLTFETTTVRKHWYENSLTRLLRKLVIENLAERLQDPTVFTSEVGRWRWKQEVKRTLAELRSRGSLTAPNEIRAAGAALMNEKTLEL